MASLEADIAHLLRRTSFSPSRRRVEELTAMGYDRALTLLVDQAAPAQVPDVPLKNINKFPELYEDFVAIIQAELDGVLQNFSSQSGRAG